MLQGIPRSARCVQRFDDSLNSAIHITYRISLRSSSMREPRDPLLKLSLKMRYINLHSVQLNGFVYGFSRLKTFFTGLQSHKCTGVCVDEKRRRAHAAK